MRVDRHVERRQVREVPHDFGFGHFRQRRRRVGQLVLRQQFIHRPDRHIDRRQRGRAAAGRLSSKSSCVA